MLAEKKQRQKHRNVYSNKTFTSNKNRIALAHFYDRFCVHKNHCINRGLLPNGNCLNAYELDNAVQKTFWAKLRDERLEPKRLVSFCNFCLILF